MPRSLLLLLALALSGCPTIEPIGDGGVDAPPTDAPRIGRDAGMPPEDVDGFVTWQMAEAGILGLAAATFREGAVDHVYTYGMANETMPVDEHTLFLVASVTKTVTGALALQLAEEGRLDLDADIATYLGFSVRHPMFPDVPITARMLASHTSGLTDDWFALGRATTTDVDSTVSLATFTADYVGVASHWAAEPGTTRSYCNAAFGVLGAVVEAAGAMPLPEQAETRIFAPLMLDGASLLLADTDLTRLASEQSWSRSGGYASLPQNGFAFYPATSLRISVTGLSRWVLANARGGELDGTRFVSADLQRLTTEAQFPSVSSGQHFVWYGIRLDGTVWNGHTGSSAGSSAMVLYHPDQSGVVILTNSDAFLRNRFGDDSGDLAMDAIATRLLAESAAAP